MTTAGDPVQRTFTATAAYPYIRQKRATAELRGQLRELVAAVGGVPDWSTLSIAGPNATLDFRGQTWFVWVGTVHLIARAEPPSTRSP